MEDFTLNSHRILIWLDDIRIPYKNAFVKQWLSKNKTAIGSPMNAIIWCKNYNEFKSIFDDENRGLFDMIDCICFDHDLASFDNNGKEYTGYDAAKLLIDYCIDNDKKLPRFISQSDNGPGRENIIKLLNNFKNFQNENSKD